MRPVPALRKRWRHLALPVEALWYGLVRYRYPACCVLRYAWDQVRECWLDRPNSPAVERGVCDQAHRKWVPCARCQCRPEARPYRPEGAVMSYRRVRWGAYVGVMDLLS